MPVHNLAKMAILGAFTGGRTPQDSTDGNGKSAEDPAMPPEWPRISESTQ